MKTLLFFLSFILFSFQAESQSFEIHDSQGIDVTGSTQFLGGDACSTVSCIYYVVNISASAKSIKACRNEISLVSGSQNAITFGLYSYAPSVDTSALSATVQPGDSVYFEGDYFPNCNVGMSTIQYCFFDINNTSDQSCLTVQFNGVVIGISEINRPDKNAIKCYVEPLSYMLYCDLPFNSNGSETITVMDITGREIPVYCVKISPSEFTAGVYGLADGIYFIHVVNSDQKEATGKFQLLR